MPNLCRHLKHNQDLHTIRDWQQDYLQNNHWVFQCLGYRTTFYKQLCYGKLSQNYLLLAPGLLHHILLDSTSIREQIYWCTGQDRNLKETKPGKNKKGGGGGFGGMLTRA